jgi:hypothetical protein
MAQLIQKFEDQDFRQRLTGWAIVAMIIYLVISQ